MLALQTIPRVGPITALRVALSDELEELGAKQAAPQDLRRAYDQANEAVLRWADEGLQVLTFFDRRYPNRLRLLHDPPPLLWVRGSIDVLSQDKLVAVIGTREPSTFGVSAARSLTSAVCEKGWGVVSGLAKGCDTLAHQQALASGAATVAVMGGGLDRIYPSENEGLAAAIVERGGALVSEQPLETRPSAGNLIRRDRLQVALGVAVIVCQTGIKGGSMHTVRFAAEQGRAVFCPDPEGTNGRSDGLRALLGSPASELCTLLPAWRDAHKLCRRLNGRPLAHAIRREDFDVLLDRLDEALAVENGEVVGDVLRPPDECAAG
ncbi:MAG TPA: DNA-processing protein DprA [Solirubrobacteraceae bacterium]|jgi:DNA processing protein